MANWVSDVYVTVETRTKQNWGGSVTGSANATNGSSITVNANSRDYIHVYYPRTWGKGSVSLYDNDNSNPDMKLYSYNGSYSDTMSSCNYSRHPGDFRTIELSGLNGFHINKSTQPAFTQQAELS